MENTFNSLYSQYVSTPLTSGLRHEIYQKMVKKAKSFNDWAIVHRYGDNSYQYRAEEQMRAKVLKGRKSSDVQKNILELFEIVTDEDEQNEILRGFLSKYSSCDDLLFVMSLSPVAVPFGSVSINDIENALEKKEEELRKMYSSMN
jgi:hypothetical protein